MPKGPRGEKRPAAGASTTPWSRDKILALIEAWEPMEDGSLLVG